MTGETPENHSAASPGIVQHYLPHSLLCLIFLMPYSLEIGRRDEIFANNWHLGRM
jgi:hypothetical protein